MSAQSGAASQKARASAGARKGRVGGDVDWRSCTGEGCRGREQEGDSGRGAWDWLPTVSSPPSAINVNGRTRTKVKEGHSLGPAVPCRFEGWLHVQRWQKGHRGTVSSPGGIGVRGERPASLASG